MHVFSDIHIAVAIASKSHAGSGYQCRLCLPTQGEAACRRPQSFLRKDHGTVSTTAVVSTVYLDFVLLFCSVLILSISAILFRDVSDECAKDFA